MKIWGRLSSINVRKVVWAAQETAAPFTRVDAGADFGVVETAAYQQMNPNALVPTLQHGALILWESNVIVRYLATQYPESPLLPRDTAPRFLADQWMDWQQTTFTRPGREAFIQLIPPPPAHPRPAPVAQPLGATRRGRHACDWP